MDKVTKALNRFSEDEQNRIKTILFRIKIGAFYGLDVKKLKGHNNIFRVRKGKIRIIYRIDQNNNIYVLTVERRSDNTYNF